MPYLGVAPAPTGSVGTNDIADGAISTAKLADSAVSTVKLANDAVGNTKLDLSADYAFTGTVSGAGVNNRVLLETGNFSTVSSLTIGSSSNLTTTYDTYLVEVRDFVPSGAVSFRLQVLLNGSRITSSVYNYFGVNQESGDSVSQRSSNSGTYFPLAGDQDVQYGGACDITFTNPTVTDRYAKFWYRSTFARSNNVNVGGYYNGHLRTSPTNITGIYFFTSSGTMNRGTARLYGLNKT